MIVPRFKHKPLISEEWRVSNQTNFLKFHCCILILPNVEFFAYQSMKTHSFLILTNHRFLTRHLLLTLGKLMFQILILSFQLLVCLCCLFRFNFKFWRQNILGRELSGCLGCRQSQFYSIDSWHDFKTYSDSKRSEEVIRQQSLHKLLQK